MEQAPDTTQTILQGMDTIAHRTMREHIHFVKSTGLSMAQFGILMQLYYHKGCQITGISSQMQISGAAASQLVDKLVQAGLIARDEDPSDRRVRQIRLTESGRRMVQQSLESRHAMLHRVIEELSPAEAQQVSQAMRILQSIFDEARAAEGQPTD